MIPAAAAAAAAAAADDRGHVQISQRLLLANIFPGLVVDVPIMLLSRQWESTAFHNDAPP